MDKFKKLFIGWAIAIVIMYSSIIVFIGWIIIKLLQFWGVI